MSGMTERKPNAGFPMKDVGSDEEGGSRFAREGKRARALLFSEFPWFTIHQILAKR